jgi:hypothetical protein
MHYYHMFDHCREPKSTAFDDWKPTRQEETKYLNLSISPRMVNEEMPFHSRLTFWDQIISSLNSKDEL